MKKKINWNIWSVARIRFTLWREKRRKAAIDKKYHNILIDCRKHATDLWGEGKFIDEAQWNSPVDRLLMPKDTPANETPCGAIVRVISNGEAFCIGVNVLMAWPQNIYSLTLTSSDETTELTFTSEAPNSDLGTQRFYEQAFWRWVTTRNRDSEAILIAWHKIAELQKTLERVSRGSIEEPA